MRGDVLQRCVAEFVGTFALVFVGAGSIAVTAGTDGALVAVALAHGLVIGVMASAVGHISGGHFNPAVTLGFFLTRRMAPGLAASYWVAQFGAAVLGALFLTLAVPSALTDPVELGAPLVGDGVGAGAAVVLEAVLTFFLVWVIFATAADPRGAFTSIAGLAIGLTITFDILIGGPLTGAAMNPARAFGPELVQGAWDDFWVWYLGPIVGGAAAALLYEALYLRPARPEPVGPAETGLEEPRPGDAAAR
ncbi:MAG: aquaporin [Actinomycetota bacterium]|nr:aquaporin [Actinomycetota bacterium]